MMLTWVARSACTRCQKVEAEKRCSKDQQQAIFRLQVKPLHEGFAGADQALLAVHHTLGEAGGAGGVNNDAGGLGVATRRRQGLACASPPLAHFVQHGRHTSLGQRLARHRHGFYIGQQHRRATVADNVRHLLKFELRIDGNENRSHASSRKQQKQMPRAVASHDHDAVAGLHAVGTQLEGHALDGFLDLLPAP